jgi:signal transduction histidine kinase
MPNVNRKKKLLVFLSHAREDKPLVRKLYKRLLADGFDPWLDEDRLLPGQDWNFEIEQALRKCDSILLCFSTQSTAKEGYIQREYKKAMDYQLEKPEGSIFVIPVRFDNCEIPFFLRDLQCVDYPSGYEKLVLSLNLRAGKASLRRKSSKSAVSSKENIRQVQLVLEGTFEEFNETRQEDLVSVLASLLRVDSESIRILQVYSGSIIVVVEMPGAAADRLAELAETRDFRLKSQGILAIKVDNEPEISLSFTEQEPMLRNILENAVNILNCEAGSLFLIDEPTGALTARMTTGPAVDQLLAHQLLAQTEIANRAAQLRAPVIDNNPTHLYADIVGDDKEPGFVIRSFMAVPMQIKDRVLGVIKVVNRRDDLPFSEDDQNLLNAFASQAAFSIENARLLTLADKELANKYDEVPRTNLAKSEFVSFVEHELRNPLTSVKGYIELLLTGSVGQINEMQANFLSTIRANVERMSALVSDLSENAKIEAGRLRLDYQPVDVPDIVNEVIRATKRQIEAKQQIVEVHLPSQLPQVWADRLRMGQVLTNLVSNAHNYTPEGGKILVRAEVTSDPWSPEGANQDVHLWVKDNGIGISIEDQEKIFQKFFRSDDSKTREVSGTGLGLNISKSVVEMMGGRIWFESEFGKGTTFHFTIPVAEG